MVKISITTLQATPYQDFIANIYLSLSWNIANINFFDLSSSSFSCLQIEWFGSDVYDKVHSQQLASAYFGRPPPAGLIQPPYYIENCCVHEDKSFSRCQVRYEGIESERFYTIYVVF